MRHEFFDGVRIQKDPMKFIATNGMDAIRSYVCPDFSDIGSREVITDV